MANQSNRKYEGGQGEVTRLHKQRESMSSNDGDDAGPDTRAGTQNPAGARLGEDREQHDEAEKNSELRKEKGSQKS